MNWTLALVVGIYFGNKVPFWIAKVTSFFQRRSVLKTMLPKNLDPAKICRGPHWWLDASIYTDEGDKRIKVCSVCGLIQGTRTVATQEAIDRIEEGLRYKELEDKIYKEFTIKEDSDIKRFFDNELKNGMSFEKLQKLHTAGATFQQRYVAFRVNKAAEVEKELSRSDS